MLNCVQTIRGRTPTSNRLRVAYIACMLLIALARPFEAGTPLVVGPSVAPGKWGTPIATHFFKFAPTEEGAPSEETVLFFRQDGKALYFFFDCKQSHSKLWAPLTKRDQAMHAGISDGVFVYIDPTGEGRYQYFFGVNPRGVQEDGIAQGTEDLSWDGVWQSKAKMRASGYTVEIRIPFSILRFAPGKTHWYVMAMRLIASKGEVDAYPRQSRNISDFTKQALPIVVHPSAPYGEKAVMPFIAVQDDPHRIKGKVGADLESTIGQRSVLDVTLNPDFGQVEADVPQFDVNNRYPLYYPEKRPFFLEHNELFTNMPISAFYTRQVVDPLAGVRVSGDSGSTHYTALYVREQEEDGIYGSSNSTDLAFRATSDLYASSYLGGILVYRGDGGQNYNAVGGTDGNLRFGQHSYFSFCALMDKDVAQAADTHGGAIETTLGYSDKSITATFNPFLYSKDFVDRLGYIQRNDYGGVGGNFGYTYWLNGGCLASVTPSVYGLWARDSAGNTTDKKWLFSVVFDFMGNNTLTIQHSTYMERWDKSCFNQGDWLFSAAWMSNRWVKVGADYSMGDSIYYAGNFLGKENRIDASFTITPVPWLRIDCVGAKDKFTHLDGTLVYDVNIAYLQAEWTLSLRSFLRATYSRSSSDQGIYYNLLMGWIEEPGSVVYAGITREKNIPFGSPWQDLVYLKIGHRFNW